MPIGQRYRFWLDQMHLRNALSRSGRTPRYDSRMAGRGPSIRHSCGSYDPMSSFQSAGSRVMNSVMSRMLSGS